MKQIYQIISIFPTFFKGFKLRLKLTIWPFEVDYMDVEIKIRFFGVKTAFLVIGP
jgi:hypothetical protein